VTSQRRQGVTSDTDGSQHARVSDYLGGHYDWSEVEADETAMWRASLSSQRMTVAALESV